MNFLDNFEVLLSFIVLFGAGELVGFTVSNRALKPELNALKAKVADKVKELKECYDKINKQQSELAYFEYSWSSHLRKVEEYNVGWKNLCKEWDVLATEQEEHTKRLSEVENYKVSNIKLKNSLRKSVNRNQEFKKKITEMKSVIRKLEIWGDELVQKVYALENQLDHERENS